MKSKIIIITILITTIFMINFCTNPNYIKVESFVGVGGYDRIKLEWSNPTHQDFTEVTIRKSDSDFPNSIDDGDEVYTGLDETYTDIDALTNTTYYYSIFCKYGEYITEPESIEVSTSDDHGAFRIVNSWGEGTSWENVPDGKYWITFGAAKKTSLYSGFWEPQTELHEVKATINFHITHNYRSDFSIYLGVGNSSSPIIEKEFIELLIPGHNLGDQPFPNNNIHLDISEFYPNMNNNQVYIRLTDKSDQNGGHADTGTINSAGMKIWTTTTYGDGSTPDLEYTLTSLPMTTTNDQEIVLTFSNHMGNIPAAKKSVATQENNDYYYLSTPPRKVVDEFRKQFGTYDENKNYNVKYKGNGTGSIPPTEKEWEEMLSKSNYAYPNSGLKSKADGLEFFDNSAEIYFPPIGHQGGQGSCNSYVVVYYIHTFYNAKLNNYDLSSCVWDNGIPASYQDKVMNPDFVYNIVCSGNNVGAASDDNFEMLRLYGTTDWTYPYDDTDWISWPTEDEFIKAPVNRIVTDVSDMSWLMISSDDYVDLVIQNLEQGILLHTFIDGYKYNTLSDKDVWTSENIPASWTLNHGNTIIGYKLMFDPENP